jgi:hypothetical protein
VARAESGVYGSARPGRQALLPRLLGAVPSRSMSDPRCNVHRPARCPMSTTASGLAAPVTNHPASTPQFRTPAYKYRVVARGRVAQRFVAFPVASHVHCRSFSRGSRRRCRPGNILWWPCPRVCALHCILGVFGGTNVRAHPRIHGETLTRLAGYTIICSQCPIAFYTVNYPDEKAQF